MELRLALDTVPAEAVCCPMEEAEQLASTKDKPKKNCPICSKLMNAKRQYCSAACWHTAKANGGRGMSEQSQPEPLATSTGENGKAKTVKNRTVSKRGIVGEGAPTKALPELFEAVLFDQARGFTREQSCARNGCSHDQWQEWEKRPEFPTLRDRALAQRIDYLLNAMEEAQKDKRDWRVFAWQLERVKAYREQFGDPAKIQINQQFNNGNSGVSQAELEQMRQRLDETRLQQQKRKAGVATNAELREYFVERRDEFQRLIDCLDAGMTPDQEDQQKLYRLHEESSDRQPPIKGIEGHVTDSNDHHQLSIKDAAEPKRQAPQEHSMRGSDMDPLSGVLKQPEPEHVRQRDRKQLAGPSSLRQRLEQEKARRGGDGKMPFSFLR